MITYGVLTVLRWEQLDDTEMADADMTSAIWRGREDKGV